jgi:hypothetical protein
MSLGRPALSTELQIKHRFAAQHAPTRPTSSSTRIQQEDFMKIRALAFVLLLAAAPAFAADVDGKWTGSIDTPNGPVQVAYTFKADGATLTGSTAGPDGAVIALKNGKVDGNKISFSMDVNMGDMPTTFAYTGVVSATEIKLHTDFMGQAIDFSVKKSP